MFNNFKQTFRKQRPNLLITHQLCGKNAEIYHVMLNRRLRNAMRPEIFYIVHDLKNNAFVIEDFVLDCFNEKFWYMSDDKLEQFFYQDIPLQDDARYTMYDPSFYSLPKPQKTNLKNIPNKELESFFYDDVVSWFLISAMFYKLEWYMNPKVYDKISVKYVPGKDFESFEIGNVCSIVKDKSGNYKLVVPATQKYPGGVLTQMDAPKSCFEKIYSLAAQTSLTRCQKSNTDTETCLTDDFFDYWKKYTQLRARRQPLPPEKYWQLKFSQRVK